jgi:hypothetical protein
MEWLSRTALDNIGEGARGYHACNITLIVLVAGFGFQFGSLDGLDNPLREQNEKLL